MSRTLIGASAVLVALLLVHHSPEARQDRQASLDLAAFFTPATGLVRDSNGDGIADRVAAKIIVPATPSREDSVAAANIAGRLGFETSALSLPLVVREGDIRQPASVEVPILVGRSNRFIAPLVERGDVSLSSLQPGQGLIAVVRSPLGAGPGLVVVGGDDEGTLAAGTELAARLPFGSGT